MPFHRFPDGSPKSFGTVDSNAKTTPLFNKPVDLESFSASNKRISPLFSNVSDVDSFPTRPSSAESKSPSRTLFNDMTRKNASVQTPTNSFGTFQSSSAPLLGSSGNTPPGSLLQKRSPLGDNGQINAFSGRPSPVNDVHQMPSVPSGPDFEKPVSAAPRLSNSSQGQLPRSRQTSPQPQSSRLFASTIQHSKPNTEFSTSILSSEQQRDELAKGRRLRRFNDDVDTVITKSSRTVNNVDSWNVLDQVVQRQYNESNGVRAVERKALVPDPLTEADGPDGLTERDWQSTEAIQGTCPDMCPESERQERERKGDLDKLERVDGDRNQTSRELAVKKYTRTAERLASLIRPINVLLMTMDHLLELLNRAYDGELLNLHNFLWDRMRAIRMDLRMQHVFDQHAVTMHEQMIRFHILAMHELCEYAKGEGFTEGFDAHLNIEQMNKASVDLFHMYDDLRKSGNPCKHEAEFRGYYALLKLDKHPGYMVEPAELSLDLAKMTPEMRNSSEVQFARKVARSCRSGNYLAFFRLARSATYLQACLMHAHFSKLRSQAMASLHSGLQKNQGIPLLQVEEWLAMEDEDIDALAEYHGFSKKNYEELYMVKEGSFLNKDQDFKTKRSKLVEQKRSSKVRDDVISPGQQNVSIEPAFEKSASFRRHSDVHTTVIALADEEMPDYEEDEQTLENSKDGNLALTQPVVVAQTSGNSKSGLGGFIWPKMDIPLPQPKLEIPVTTLARDTVNNGFAPSLTQIPNLEKNWVYMGKRRKSLSPLESDVHTTPEPIKSREKKQRSHENVIVATIPQVVNVVEVSPVIEFDPHEKEKERQAALEAEADLYRARFLFRRWRSKAAAKAEERRWRQQKLDTALGSFHLGLPIQTNRKIAFPEDYIAPVNHLSSTCVELDFEQIQKQRLDNMDRMWEGLDVVQIVASVLKQRNPDSKFLSWKLITCSRVYNLESGAQKRYSKAGEWLLAKLFHQTPSERPGDRPPRILLHNVSVDRNEDEIPCYYIGRDLSFQLGSIEHTEGIQGASGIIFLISDSTPLIAEKDRLHALVNSFQSGVKLPLLVLYTELHASINTEVPSFKLKNLNELGKIATLLDMDKLDENRVSCWTILSVMEKHCRGVYSESVLKEGISWLSAMAPKQPYVRYCTLYDLFMEHLNPLFKILLDMQPSTVTPELCVRTFNEALRRTAMEINVTASKYHFYWPPDELRDIFGEYVAQERILLPSPGWNEATTIGPILEALQVCQLPEFQWTEKGLVGTYNNLKGQKDVLQAMLHTYINEIYGSSPGDLLSLQTVDAMIQRGCIFRHTVERRMLIPNWVPIFQHIYSMRMSALQSEPPAIVWISRKDSEQFETHSVEKIPDLSEYVGPTLDEMIQMQSQESTINVVPFNNHIDMTLVARDEPTEMEEVVLPSRTELNAEPSVDEDDIMVLQDALSIQKDSTDFARLISLPTEGELQLDSLVNDFCRRVDQELAEAVEFREDQESYYMKHGNDYACEVNGRNTVHDDSFMVDSTHFAESSSFGTADGMDRLTVLLQRCENVQKTLDKKLREFFEVEKTN